jgi:hypothetical protein
MSADRRMTLLGDITMKTAKTAVAARLGDAGADKTKNG